MLLGMILGKEGSCGICLLRFEAKGAGRLSLRLVMSRFERGVWEGYRHIDNCSSMRFGTAVARVFQITWRNLEYVLKSE